MIVFVHLLNDRSGSPRVLCSAISALARDGDRSRLFVGSEGSGCLEDVGPPITRYWYRRTPFRVLTLFTYLASQIALLIRLFRAHGIDRNALIYVNTLLPFGAALFGRLTGRPVVYHLHEVSLSPAPLKWFLTHIAAFTANRLIYVSDFHRNYLPIPAVPASTVHNALDEAFLARANGMPYHHRRGGRFNVLMLASLRDYKGIPEYISLAARLMTRPEMHFELVANDDEEMILSYFSTINIPPNVTIYPRTENPAEYYSRASLVLNLSRPDQWVETFGLTLLEAMAYGIPVIAPPIGGPTELVEDGVEGFLVDCRLPELLLKKVSQLAEGEELSLAMSASARRKAARFSPLAFECALRETLSFNTVTDHVN